MNSEIFKEVENEMDNQENRWGLQNHPCLDQDLLNRDGGCTEQRMCEHYEVPSQSRAKIITDIKVERGDLTYADIALEEFCEVVSEFDVIKRREELIQLSAVCMSWIKKIDRDLKSEKDGQ